MGNAHSQAAQKFPLCEKQKSVTFLTTEMLLTLLHFSGGLFSTFLPPVTSDNSSSSGQHKQIWHFYSSHSSLIFCFCCCSFTCIKMRILPKTLSCVKQPVSLRDSEHQVFTDGFQVDPEVAAKNLQLRELRLFSPEKRRETLSLSKTAWKEAAARWGPVLGKKQQHERKYLNLHQARFRLDMRKNSSLKG